MLRGWQVALVLTAFVANAFGAAPTNLGVCSYADPVKIGNNDIDAMNSNFVDDELSGHTIYKPVWLSFNAPVDGAYTFELIDWHVRSVVTGEDDSRMAIYGGKWPRDCYRPHLKAYSDDQEDQDDDGDDDDGDRKSRFTVVLAKGIYKIAVGNARPEGVAGQGTLQITLREGWCDGQAYVARLGNNEVVTRTTEAPSYNYVHKPVWFKFTAPYSEVYTIETTRWDSEDSAKRAETVNIDDSDINAEFGYSDDDSEIAVYTGTCADLTEEGRNDNKGSNDGWQNPRAEVDGTTEETLELSPVEDEDSAEFGSSKLSFLRVFVAEGDSIYIEVGNARSRQRNSVGNLKISVSHGHCSSRPNYWTTIETGYNRVSAEYSGAPDIHLRWRGDDETIDDPVWLTFEVQTPGAYKFEMLWWNQDDGDSAMAIYSGTWPEDCLTEDGPTLVYYNDDTFLHGGRKRSLSDGEELAARVELDALEVEDAAQIQSFGGRNKNSLIVVPLEVGTYKVAVGNGGYSRAGKGGLKITILDGWCNDQILTATVDTWIDVDARDSLNYDDNDNDIYKSVWFKFEAPSDDIFVFEVKRWDEGDSKIAIFDGSCDNLNRLAINDDIFKRDVEQNFGSFNHDRRSRTEYTLTQGQTVYIEVGNADDDDDYSDGKLYISVPEGRCQSAIEGYVTGKPSRTEELPLNPIWIDTRKADLHKVRVGNNKYFYDVAYVKFHTDVAAEYQFSVIEWDKPEYGQKKVVMGIFSGSCGSLNALELDSDDDDLGDVDYYLQADTTYYVIIGNREEREDGQGKGKLIIQRHYGRCEDFYSNRMPSLTAGLNDVNSTYSDASTVGLFSPFIYQPIWYKFTAPQSGEWTFDIINWDQDVNDSAIRVVKDCLLPNPIPVDESDNPENQLSRVTRYLTKYSTYRVAVGNGKNTASGGSGLPGSGTINIFRANAGTCRNPEIAEEGSNFIGNASWPNINQEDDIEYPVWSLFTAPRDGTYTIEVMSWWNGANNDSKMIVYEYKDPFFGINGCDRSRDEKASDDNDGRRLLSEVEVTLDEDEKIWIVIGNSHDNTGPGQGWFEITWRKGRCNTPIVATGENYALIELNATLAHARKIEVQNKRIFWPVWVQFKPQQSGWFVITVDEWDNRGDNDAQMVLWEGKGCRVQNDNPKRIDDNYYSSKLPLIETYLKSSKTYTIAVGNDKPGQHTGVGKVSIAPFGRCENSDRIYKGENNIESTPAVGVNITEPEGAEINSPIWLTYRAWKRGRYHFTVTDWDNGAETRSDDTVMSIYSGPCQDPHFIKSNDNNNHYGATLKSRVEIKMWRHRSLHIVVGNKEAITTGSGKLLVTYRPEPAKFAIAVPINATEEEIEAGLNRALGFPEDTDLINFIEQPRQASSGKRSVTDGHEATPENGDYHTIYIEPAEDHDEDMGDLTNALANHGDSYRSIGFNVGPLFCYADCEGHDFDNDGVDDSVDVCPGVYDPRQRNSDHQGFGDACQCANEGFFVDPGYIQECDFLDRFSHQETFYHGEDKRPGDWARVYVQQHGSVSFEPGSYTHTNKWLDCNCHTWDIDDGVN